MEISEAITIAKSLRSQYEQLEIQRYGRAWTVEEIALGFVGDVGDLAKLVQAAHGVRDIPDAQDRMAHELADCLWSILILADKLGVNIEKAYSTTTTELTRSVQSQLTAS